MDSPSKAPDQPRRAFVLPPSGTDEPPRLHRRRATGRRPRATMRGLLGPARPPDTRSGLRGLLGERREPHSVGVARPYGPDRPGAIGWPLRRSPSADHPRLQVRKAPNALGPLGREDACGWHRSVIRCELRGARSSSRMASCHPRLQSGGRSRRLSRPAGRPCALEDQGDRATNRADGHRTPAQRSRCVFDVSRAVSSRTPKHARGSGSRAGRRCANDRCDVGCLRGCSQEGRRARGPRAHDGTGRTGISAIVTNGLHEPTFPPRSGSRRAAATACRSRRAGRSPRRGLCR
jgi:hypothetical protein